MLPLTTIALCALLQSAKDPRTSPLLVEDALLHIPDVTGKLQVVGDLDGDGVGDLIARRGGKRGSRDQPGRIEAVSLVSGETIRVLFEPAPPVEWDASGDLDGDGTHDLVVATGGSVVAISGTTAEELWELVADANDPGFGASLTILGDLDGDECDDVAIGHVELDPRSRWLPLGEIVSWVSDSAFTSTGERKLREFVVLRNGERREKWSFYREALQARSPHPGHVSLRSGRDGSELLRVPGTHPGLAFGTRVSPAGDVDADGVPDLGVHSEPEARVPTVIVSGASGLTLREIEGRGGILGLAGDVDGDGSPDHHHDERNGGHRGPTVAVLSGETAETLFELPYPDYWSEHAYTVAVGDIDGDGLDDLGLADPDFHLAGPPREEQPLDLASMTLEEAIAIETAPWCSMSWHSGSVVVYSSCTRSPVLAFFGAAGSMRGLGLELAATDDVSGDGFPDLIVADESDAYVFAGPGPAPSISDPGRSR